ncbi:hypothetical protein ACS33_15515 [Edwardsiella ictaluri]|nr:hypothetical protein ABY58_15615 [Edwardsiella ictaluri]KOO54182.1 hypothetical protein ACS33_15515 [Edwardsiella ictaluri]
MLVSQRMPQFKTYFQHHLVAEIKQICQINYHHIPQNQFDNNGISMFIITQQDITICEQRVPLQGNTQVLTLLCHFPTAIFIHITMFESQIIQLIRLKLFGPDRVRFHIS